MAERGAAKHWIARPPPGDAAASSAEIEAWMGGRSPAPDWETVLGRLRDTLSALAAPGPLRDDPEGRRLLRALAEADTPEALDGALDRLRVRTEALVAARPTRRRPAQDLALPEPAVRAGRMILRL